MKMIGGKRGWNRGRLMYFFLLLKSRLILGGEQGRLVTSSLPRLILY